jgi:hypothetical protein
MPLGMRTTSTTRRSMLPGQLVTTMMILTPSQSECSSTTSEMPISHSMVRQDSTKTTQMVTKVVMTSNFQATTVPRNYMLSGTSVCTSSKTLPSFHSKKILSRPLMNLSPPSFPDGQSASLPTSLTLTQPLGKTNLSRSLKTSPTLASKKERPFQLHTSQKVLQFSKDNLLPLDTDWPTL